jgi:hypothetical protein
VNWLRDEQRSEGPGGVITFAISVRMTGALKQHIVRLPNAFGNRIEAMVKRSPNALTC